uniref:NADH-ubiquinone oxidoreductase chain 6 n=1 Tax=Pennisetia hylaeiformis TaxID=301031 RepID=A0A076EBM0_9NEOP|nr:NADH dehydrogenase subunit 6 [Pennisetia hylaeiformis]
MKYLISINLLIFNLFMLFINHPLTMGFMILTQTFLICLLSGMMFKSYWFSYILFLVFLGGLLILFIYVSSIASNELFKNLIKTKNFLIFIFIIILTLLMFYIMSNNLNWLNFWLNTDMNNYFNFYLFLNNENKINLSKLYNNYTFLLTIMLIIYLLITLFTVIKITNIYFGPLRSNFN